MNIKSNSSSPALDRSFVARSGERGAALAASLLMLALLSAVALTVLAVVTTETRIAGSDLKRTQTFYASAAGIEKMTSDYSALFRDSARPTDAQVASIANNPPSELVTLEGFKFTQSIVVDTETLNTMKTTQGITDPNKLPTATLAADSPYVGLIASVKPYTLSSRATSPDGTSVTLTRTMNNYLIPLFQFGMFSDNDIELHPGTTFVFNGRVHANGNIYLAGKVTLLDKVTSGHEVIYADQRNGEAFTSVTNEVWMGVGASQIHVDLTKGSMSKGPHISCTDPDGAGPLPPAGVNCFPGSPVGTSWAGASPSSTFDWKATSVKPAVVNIDNQFGGQLLTRVTGAAPLKLPMELDGNPTREIIKRRLPTDNATPIPPSDQTSPLSDSRYHSKSGIRILIDDEGVTTDKAGLDAAQNGDGTNNKGVNLSGTTIGTVPGFDPIPLPNTATNGGRALWRIKDDGTYRDLTTNCPYQQNIAAPLQALTVRGSRSTTQTAITPNGSTIVIPKIPAGAGLSGHILIQIEDKDGVWRDVTKEILSLGITEGEPNAIVNLQRPLWAAFTQGSRDASGGSNNLTDILNETGSGYISADGEIKTSSSRPDQDTTYGFLRKVEEDDADVSGSHPIRADTPPAVCNPSKWGDGTNYWYTNKCWNSIVPINVYNVREGRISTETTSPYDKTEEANAVYERGISSVLEINMHNLARWMDGVYDTNLLAGTGAVSSNIRNPDGYVVYISDRRGDNINSMTLPQFGSSPASNTTFNATNGMDDNVDIYGPNNKMDAGEDVQETGQAVGGTLTKDTAELPDPVSNGDYGNPTSLDERTRRALTVAGRPNGSTYFRRAVRLFNAEDLQTTGAAGKLGITQGITMASENMVYTWGNYNTQGINTAPGSGESSLNDANATSHYMPVATTLCTSCDRQVPASIVGDAWIPLSKTWFDGESALYPDDLSKRIGDLIIPTTSTLAVTEETSVRAGIIAGNNLSALAGQPDAGNDAQHESKLNGGMHNFPRFTEFWGGRFNFAGALIPLYRSTQALGPYNANSTIYDPPVRNWAFDITFTNPLRLPPGTPMFQHIEPTGFKQVL